MIATTAAVPASHLSQATGNDDRLTTTADDDDKSTLSSGLSSARNVNDQNDLKQKLTT